MPQCPEVRGGLLPGRAIALSACAGNALGALTPAAATSEECHQKAREDDAWLGCHASMVAPFGLRLKPRKPLRHFEPWSGWPPAHSVASRWRQTFHASASFSGAVFARFGRPVPSTRGHDGPWFRPPTLPAHRSGPLRHPSHCVEAGKGFQGAAARDPAPVGTVAPRGPNHAALAAGEGRFHTEGEHAPSARPRRPAATKPCREGVVTGRALAGNPVARPCPALAQACENTAAVGSGSPPSDAFKPMAFTSF